jgi:hypothetical protein
MFGDAPPENAALEQALGVETGVAPRRVRVSPRVGFSYTYSRSRENGNGQMNTNTGSWYRNTMGIIRGGIGEFRDLYRPGTLADAMVGAGISGSTLALSCVGSTVPTPNWSGFAAGTTALPTSCADGNGTLVECNPRGQVLRCAAQLARIAGLGIEHAWLHGQGGRPRIVRPLAAQHRRREFPREYGVPPGR